MKNNILIISVFILLAANLGCQTCYANNIARYKKCKKIEIKTSLVLPADTVPPVDAMEVITKAINSLNNFDIEAVAGLYTPNAVIADDEPPYSWNGPTAGVQWVNAVEQACKTFKITKLKGRIGAVNVFQQNADNIYIIVPVSYTGSMPGKARFTAIGAFTFVLRMTNSKWMIKSQVWVPKKGM
jgi:ketosteroid isomerase-like protein